MPGRHSHAGGRPIARWAIACLCCSPALAQDAASTQRDAAPPLPHVIAGDEEGDCFGATVADVGDVDGDGCRDFAVGAVNHLGRSTRYVRVFSGADRAPLLTLRDARAGTALFGSSIAAAGDVDGDGHGDVIVGSPRFLLGRGNAQVFSGADGRRLWKLEAEGGGSSFGWSVCSPGDLDDDGRPDLAVSSYQSFETGIVVVYSGATGEEIDRIESLHGGAVLANAGDLDGDGRDDLLVGCPSRSVEEMFQGETLLFSGATRKELRRWPGPRIHTSMGSVVAGVGDLDDDGVGDLLICAKGLDRKGNNAGGAFVVSGADGNVMYRLDSPKAGTEFGTRCSRLDDLDGDGVSEFAVLTQRSGSAPYVPGRAYVYSGKSGDLLDSYEGQAIASLPPHGDRDEPLLILGRPSAGQPLPAGQVGSVIVLRR